MRLDLKDKKLLQQKFEPKNNFLYNHNETHFIIDSGGDFMDQKSTPSTVQSIDRAIEILECFNENEIELSLADICNKVKIPKPTVLRIVSTLASHGYLLQNDEQQYKLGLKFMYLASLVKGSIHIRNIALPMMKQLADETGETVDLNVLDKHERICLEKVESVHQLRNIIQIGERNTLMRGASGKALLAFQDENYIKNTFDYYGISDSDFIDRFLKELEQVKEQGYAISYGERVPEAFAISSPIFDHCNKVNACITLTGPSFRLIGKETSYIESIIRSGAETSKRMGNVKKKK